MIVTTNVDPYCRGRATLLASWEEYTRGSVHAIVHRFPGVVAAVFPHQPERGVYNNALLHRGLGPHERGRAVVAMQAAYADANVDRFAAWVHKSTSPCAPNWNDAGSRSTQRPGPWACHSTTSVFLIRRSALARRNGRNTCITSACRQTFSRVQITRRFTSSPPATPGRSWPQRWHTTTGPTAASTT